MNMSTLQAVTPTDYYKQASAKLNDTGQNQQFGTILQSAMDMINETNSLEQNAETESIRFALGEAENTHDLQIAQYKANYALMYTSAVRNKVLDAYKEIMNMQI
ncbi:MAG: flagellar hook-basal body complex protein FliE [Lachnospiraceae bacterium]